MRIEIAWFSRLLNAAKIAISFSDGHHARTRADVVKKRLRLR